MQTQQMENEKFEIFSIEVLDQAENILRDVKEEIEIENRIDKVLELTDAIRFEQESVSLIDRIRNTDAEISMAINCPNFPVVTGEVRFTSDEYLVLAKDKNNFLINLSQVSYVVGVDNLATFRPNEFQVNTTFLWIKNLIDAENLLTIFLTNGNQLQGQLIRFSDDHFDLRVKNHNFLIPSSAIVLIRSTNEI